MNRIGWVFVVTVLAAVTLFALAARPGTETAPRSAAFVTERVRQRDPALPARAMIVPVAGVPVRQLADTWGEAREAGQRVHEAIDIPAPGGTPVVAAFAGTVEKLFQSARGGTTVYVRSDDARTMAYYAHLAAYAPGLAEGTRVTRGQPVGTVGDTGDAGPGNTHLHFGVAAMRRGERWWQGTPVNPYPLLVGQASAR